VLLLGLFGERPMPAHLRFGWTRQRLAHAVVAYVPEMADLPSRWERTLAWAPAHVVSRRLRSGVRLCP